MASKVGRIEIPALKSGSPEKADPKVCLSVFRK